ncbi:hypothetical protein, partial [Pseudomonas sp. TWP3-2]|uniref:hypothetical protein n=1 Tax=Pseudomonas sp. TWP3-2 TaxID=2804574 RepID=UPI003CFB3FB2
MARKKIEGTDVQPKPAGDKESPDSGKTRVFAPPVPPEVKVRGGRIQKTPPKKAPKKPVPATKKPRAT